MEKAKKMIVKFYVGIMLILLYLSVHTMQNFGFEFSNSFLDDMRGAFWLGMIALLGIEFFEQVLKLIKEYKNKKNED